MIKGVEFLLCIALIYPVFAAEPPVGFQNAVWGMSASEVRSTVKPEQWKQVQLETDFPEELNLSVYSSSADIAGYPAEIRYFFVEDRFFQVTVVFDFDHLASYDFNYNVFRSVDEYYRHIRDQSLTFVHDIYDLLRKKYGKKQPVFKGLDPRKIFLNTDRYIQKERWNLRYHPSEYYKRIITSAYARWDFPKTRVIFSVNVSAADKRFDYMLSLTSLDFEKYINKRKDMLRMENL
ncbi:MAG: hypothetical protein GF401_18645 [Chitinivibrionales bacterium]|nr:hypothetical protein [Chitinivibrionales bacterium]